MSIKTDEEITKGQHYISRGILKHFSPNQHALFELLVNKNKEPFPTNIIDTMKMTFTYEHERLPINTIEKFFSKIEDKAIPKLDKLLEIASDEEIDWENLKRFLFEIFPELLVFYYRSGALLTEYSHIQKEDKIPLLSEKILNLPYLRLLTNTIKNDYKLCVLQSDNEFILSDQYISTAALGIKGMYMNISNRNIGMEETLILIPLSSEYYIALWNGKTPTPFRENTIITLCKEEVRKINNIILNNSYVKCVSYKKETLDDIKDSFDRVFPTTFYVGYNDGSTGGAIKKKELFYYKEDEEAYSLLETTQAFEYQKLERNQQCLCGSGKKYKKCHLPIINRLDTAFLIFKNNKTRDGIYIENSQKVIELPISQWHNIAKAENISERDSE